MLRIETDVNNADKHALQTILAFTDLKHHKDISVNKYNEKGITVLLRSLEASPK